MKQAQRNKAMIKNMLLLIGMLWSTTFSIAQDFRTELFRMNDTYRKADNFSMKVNVKIYEKQSDTRERQSYEGMVKKQGNNYLSQMMGKTTLVNNNCVLLVDEGNKLIQYGDRPKDKKNPTDDKALCYAIDSVYLANNKLKMLSSEEGHMRILVSSEGDEVYEKTEILINTVSHVLEELTYYYKDEEKAGFSKIVISYSEVKLHAAFGKSDFSEKKYITASRNSITLAANYASYKLIDQRNFNSNGL